MHIGVGGALVLLLLSLIFRVNLFTLFSGGDQTQPMEQERPAVDEAQRDAGQAREVQFVSFVLDDAQTTWDRLLPAQAKTPYNHAKLVLFRDYTQSGCGWAQSATGPFYCPADGKVYVDLAFFDELRTNFGAPGEFAQAYVLAHEIGHHVQHELGLDRQVRTLQDRYPSERNALSVKLELQADCLAGVWAHTTGQRKLIDASDIDAGLRAAAAVGDDRLQRMSTGHVSPDSFTHGSSEDRMAWFRRGLETGDITACDTFNSQ